AEAGFTRTEIFARLGMLRGIHFLVHAVSPNVAVTRMEKHAIAGLWFGNALPLDHCFDVISRNDADFARLFRDGQPLNAAVPCRIQYDAAANESVLSNMFDTVRTHANRAPATSAFIRCRVHAPVVHEHAFRSVHADM